MMRFTSTFFLANVGEKVSLIAKRIEEFQRFKHYEIHFDHEARLYLLFKRKKNASVSNNLIEPHKSQYKSHFEVKWVN